MKRLQQSDFGSNCFVKGFLLYFLNHRFRRIGTLSNLVLGVLHSVHFARKCPDPWHQS